VVAPDKFKGSLSAREAALHIAAGLRARLPALEVRQVPIADGGEGTLEAVCSAGFEFVPVRASGPTGEPVDSGFALRDGVAVIELAEVCGLRRLPEERPEPLRASSFGAGEVMRAALDAGAWTIVLGVGGSASTDGGAGLVQALGARVLDCRGRELPRGGGALLGAERLELEGLHPRLAEVQVVVLADVDNPLLGTRGAARVYGPQKGAEAAEVALLEEALARWAQLAGAHAAELPGSGAAGGVAFGARALLGARVRAGIDHVLELLRVRERLAGAQLLITGEGSLDRQTLHGKAPAGAARLAATEGVPVFAVAGRIELTAAQLRAAGIADAHALSELEPDAARCIVQAGPLLERLVAERLAPRIGLPHPANANRGAR